MSSLSMNIAALLSKEIDTRINAIMVEFSRALVAEGVDNNTIQQAWAQVSDKAVADMKTDLVKAEEKAKKAKEAVEKKVEKEGKAKCCYQGPRAKKPCGKIATQEHDEKDYCDNCYARVTKPTCGYILGKKCKEAGKVCGKACQIPHPFGFSVVIEGNDYEGVYLCNQHGKSVQGVHEKQSKPKCSHVTKNGNRCAGNAGPDGKCTKHDGSKKAAAKSDNKAVIAKALNQAVAEEVKSDAEGEPSDGEQSVEIEIVDEEEQVVEEKKEEKKSTKAKAKATKAKADEEKKEVVEEEKKVKATKSTSANKNIKSTGKAKAAEGEEEKEEKKQKTKATKSSTKSERKSKKEQQISATAPEIDVDELNLDD
jgi:hypothetical protein